MRTKYIAAALAVTASLFLATLRLQAKDSENGREAPEHSRTSPATEGVPLKVVINVSHEGKSYYVPVKVYVSSNKLAVAKADTRENQIAYVTRILQQNGDMLRVVTDGFRHFGDVRFYLGVAYDPGSDAHLHYAKPTSFSLSLSSASSGIETKKVCGRICCTNSDGKQCCAVIICPGNCDC